MCMPQLRPKEVARQLLDIRFRLHDRLEHKTVLDISEYEPMLITKLPDSVTHFATHDIERIPHKPRPFVSTAIDNKLRI